MSMWNRHQRDAACEWRIRGAGGDDARATILMFQWTP
jgi:hypothetical protein